MARIRRLTALAGVAALASAFVTGPAQADTPEVFEGSASGRALDLAVLGKQLTLGSSSAQADSAGKAKATGAGVLTPQLTTDKIASASGGTDEVKAKTCAKTAVDDVSAGGKTVELSKVLSLGLACSEAKALSSTKSASGSGSVAEAGVDAARLIKEVEEVADRPLPNEVKAIGSTLAGLLETVCEKAAGTPAGEAENGLTCDAATTIEEVTNRVLHTKTLDIEVGKSTSSVTTTGAAVTSTARSAGATVKILPLPEIDGLESDEPVVTIRVGSSKAQAIYSRSEGAATGDADPAIVRITFNTALTRSLADQLEDSEDAIPVYERLDNIILTPSDFENVQKTLEKHLQGNAPQLITSCEDGRAVCLLSETQLASKIYLASSKVDATGGTATAVADAVRMELVTGIPFELVNGNATVASLGLENPGVQLALGGVQAGVAGQQAGNGGGGGGGGGGEDDDGRRNAPPLRTELDRGGGPLPPLELPRTGGLAVLPVLGASALGLAGVLRRAARKATR